MLLTYGLSCPRSVLTLEFLFLSDKAAAFSLPFNLSVNPDPPRSDPNDVDDEFEDDKRVILLGLDRPIIVSFLDLNERILSACGNVGILLATGRAILGK